jgi:hypothetical protein
MLVMQSEVNAGSRDVRFGAYCFVYCDMLKIIPHGYKVTILGILEAVPRYIDIPGSTVLLLVPYL